VQFRLLGGAILLFSIAGLAQLSARAHSTIPNKATEIAHGKYIVENVAMCTNCHTPHLANGSPDSSRNLMGSKLSITPPTTGRWATEAPRIAGLRRWEDDEIVILLTTGKLETGLPMRRPMPQFHMTEQDARAVVAYLRSLSPPPAKRSAKGRRYMFARIR
jgi:mono/diheme cytochrome c family protein